MGVTIPQESSTPSGNSSRKGLEEGMDENITTLKFAPWQSFVDEGFWHRLAAFKLETQRLSDHPVPIVGFFAPCSHVQVPSPFQLLEESLPTDSGGSEGTDFMVLGNRNKCPVPGTLYNCNTLERFKALDTMSLLSGAVKEIWADILSGKAEESCNLLSRFLLITFADLKSWRFYYWFAFPGIKMTPPAYATFCRPVSDVFSVEECAGIKGACSQWRSAPETAGLTIFLLHFLSDGTIVGRSVKDWKVASKEDGKVVAVFLDPCNLPENPGWPLRNLLALAAARWHISALSVLFYREKRGFIDPQLSLLAKLRIPELSDWNSPGCTPEGVGWEYNSRGNARPRSVNLAATMDPNRAANQAADLNLKLMRWRLVPSLNIPLLYATKCLLLGAGAVGCEVARNLLAWGVRHVTLVDHGMVARSNPCHQSLYDMDDTSNGGKLKVDIAVAKLKRIIPGVEARGVYMTIPVPGRSVTEVDNVLADCCRLKALVDEHDVVFLMTDTRESRWLPTLLCAEANKVVINVALGSEAYLVMRHGAGPFHHEEVVETGHATFSDNRRLGCYFCNYLAGNLHLISNRAVDQQFTGSGLAPIAAAVAVNLAVNLLHHPRRLHAPADPATSITDAVTEPLGILPHQVQVFVSYSSQIVMGLASDSCPACSSNVVQEFRNRGMEFVLEVLNRANYLESSTLLRTGNQVAELDVKLTSWQLHQSVNAPLLSTKFLLLGAGTLGCEVARRLLTRGVRHITLLDYGKVALSNPCRQSLYTVDDCLNGGKLKVDAAVEKLKHVAPEVEPRGIYMSIPMPGHSVSSSEVDNVLADCNRLRALIDEHDVVFLLTDTRESRWLPTLLCAEANKVAINAALGFDSYLVMRHGADPLLREEAAEITEVPLGDNRRFGCYFCNDVVAPLDSTANRTLDQQCTVTRPGLAAIAATLAVELAVGLLQHPRRLLAPADCATSISDVIAEIPQILPHQVRGFLGLFSEMMVIGSAFDKCTACSSIVVQEFREKGLQFILKVLNKPNCLEDLTGLTEMVAATQGMSLDWDSEGDLADEL